jgi:aspartyl-tRNA(Asn)/glutamyl-tRNA(Gln) amidotransferase subunit B
MESIYDKYETVVGLEVHAQLMTHSKAFSPDPYTYGSPPNTQVSPINLAHPGTLPKPNLAGLRLALKMGIACGCDIHERTHFSRKNYFYADLPKGYQITQFTTPICTGGFITIKDAEGKDKKIRLDKIIMEEDSGKSLHDIDPFNSLIDLNRAGVPLIEIVSDPDIRHPEEAYQYLTEVRQMVQYLDICDGNMEEGSLRCDANVSIRLKGSDVLNTRVEIKNLNSIRNVQRAIAAEAKRQIELVESGGRVTPDTRGFDPVKSETFAMRSKELANDYRYFPEPDIPPIVLVKEDVELLREQMPELPKALLKRFVNELGLSEYDASVITAEKETAAWYQEIIAHTQNYKAAANWLNGPVRSWLNENALELHEFKVRPEQIAGIIRMVDENKISFSAASQKVFPELIRREGNISLDKLVTEMNLGQLDDDGLIISLIKEVLDQYPDKVQEYRSGKKGILGLFMGEVMKKSKGKADPKKTNALLLQELDH